MADEPLSGSQHPSPSASSTPQAAPPPGLPVGISLEEVRKRIRGARIALAFVGVVTLGFLIFQTVQVSDELDSYGMSFGDLPGFSLFLIVLSYIGAVAYLFLSFLAKTRPYGASLAGLIIYITDIVLGAVLDPTTIYKGIIIKVIIIAALVKAVKAGREYHTIMREEEIEKAFS